MVRAEQEKIAEIAGNAAFELHSHPGPGLLKSACQICLLKRID
jgi:hypothetical protein